MAGDGGANNDREYIVITQNPYQTQEPPQGLPLQDYEPRRTIRRRRRRRTNPTRDAVIRFAIFIVSSTAGILFAKYLIESYLQ